MRTTKIMIKGVWQGDLPDTEDVADLRSAGGSAFRGHVSPERSAPFPAESGRYHLYVSYGCPWAHRTIIYRRLKRLDRVIGMSVLHPRLGTPAGWCFAEGGDGEDATVDHVGGRRFLHEIYTAAMPNYTGKVTVPVLWDRKHQMIVNKESTEIIRMLNSAFDSVGGDGSIDYYPGPLREEIDALNGWLLPEVGAGVYTAGFAHTQAQYESAVTTLFAALDRLETLLADGRPFLLGAHITEPDWHLFCTAIRFDIAYHGRLRCNLHRYADYPHLMAHLRRLYAVPGVADTVKIDHIKQHYYDTIGEIDPRIVPMGPPVAFAPPDDDGRATNRPTP